MKEYLVKAIHRVFVNGTSVDMEVIMGLLTIGACATALYVGVADTLLHTLFRISIAVSIIQVGSAFPFNNLKIRHRSNYLMGFLALYIAFRISQVGGDTTGIGGFSGLAVSGFYCAFKTKIELH